MSTCDSQGCIDFSLQAARPLRLTPGINTGPEDNGFEMSRSWPPGVGQPTGVSNVLATVRKICQNADAAPDLIGFNQ